MPNLQTAVVLNEDFGAPAAEAAVLAFRTRDGQGGKLEVVVEMDAGNTGTLTYSLQVAPADASGNPGTFVDTAAATNLEAVVDETLTPGTRNSHTIIVRPGVDAFLLLVASGSTRGRLQLRGDFILDRWRTNLTRGQTGAALIGGKPGDVTPA